jgi:cytochrome P450
VRQDPSLIPGAMNEVLRMEAPIQGFSRLALSDYDMDGVSIPAGSRAIVFYGAANRDEREYPDPDRFDVRRNPANHLAFGAGPHVCVGVYLARMEMTALFTALARRVRRFSLGDTERALHNILRGFTKLDVTVEVEGQR